MVGVMWAPRAGLGSAVDFLRTGRTRQVPQAQLTPGPSHMQPVRMSEFPNYREGQGLPWLAVGDTQRGTPAGRVPQQHVGGAHPPPSAVLLKE